MKDIVIEQMQKSDLEDVSQIAAEQIYKGASKEQVGDWIKAIGDVSGMSIYSPWYIARTGEPGSIVAFVNYVAQDFDFPGKRVVLSISLIAVRNEFQHRGIGTLLVQSSFKCLCKRWQDKGFKPIMLRVETDEGNVTARKFYEKVFGEPEEFVLADVWGRGEGTVFYFKRLTEHFDGLGA